MAWFRAWLGKEPQDKPKEKKKDEDGLDWLKEGQLVSHKVMPGVFVIVTCYIDPMGRWFLQMRGRNGRVREISPYEVFPVKEVKGGEDVR